MIELNDLKEPFNKVPNVPKGDWFQKKCEEIADELFKNYCINCNDRKFYFAEIEFYYYEEGVWDDDWNKVTYARDGYKAGDLFYHLSGVDVCFESNLKKEKATFSGKGGGILIRAMIDSEDENSGLIVGPLTCKDIMLNACKVGEMPKLEWFANKRTSKVVSTYRFLGKSDFDKIEPSSNEHQNKDGNLKLAYFDSSIPDKDWNTARSSYYSNRLKKYEQQ
ncbi:MAG: hypothetical protein J5663_04725 [Bacteroidaceae bacterium]|nr:hypothetical protein [Bacteroidaceae bacterium]